MVSQALLFGESWEDKGGSHHATEAIREGPELRSTWVNQGELSLLIRPEKRTLKKALPARSLFPQAPHALPPAGRLAEEARGVGRPEV